MKSSQGMILIVFSLILNFIALLVMAQSESLFLFYKNLGQMIHIQSEIQFLEEEAIRLLKQKKAHVQYLIRELMKFFISCNQDRHAVSDMRNKNTVICLRI